MNHLFSYLMIVRVVSEFWVKISLCSKVLNSMILLALGSGIFFITHIKCSTFRDRPKLNTVIFKICKKRHLPPNRLVRNHPLFSIYIQGFLYRLGEDGTLLVELP
jgi:hypothetical protein